MKLCHVCSRALGDTAARTCEACGTVTHADCAALLPGCSRIDCVDAGTLRLRTLEYLRARAAQDISGYGGICGLIRAWLVVNVAVGGLVSVTSSRSFFEGVGIVTNIILYLIGMARLGHPQIEHSFLGLVIPAFLWATYDARVRGARWVAGRLGGTSMDREDLLGMLTDHDVDEEPAADQLRRMKFAFWALGGVLLFLADLLFDHFQAVMSNPKFVRGAAALIAAVVWYFGKSVRAFHQSLTERIEREKESRKLAHVLNFAISTLRRKDLSSEEKGWRFLLSDGTRCPPGVAPPPGPHDRPWQDVSTAPLLPAGALGSRGKKLAGICLVLVGLKVAVVALRLPPGLLKAPEIPKHMADFFAIDGLPEYSPQVLWIYSAEFPAHYIALTSQGLRSNDNRDVRQPYKDFYQLGWSQIWDMKMEPSAAEGAPTRITVRSAELQDHVILLPRTPDRRDLAFFADLHRSWLEKNVWEPGAPNVARHRGTPHTCPAEMLPFPAVFPRRNYPRR